MYSTRKNEWGREQRNERFKGAMEPDFAADDFEK